MQDMIQFESDFTPGAKIKVVGVGGGGTNAVDSMVESGMRAVEFFVVNTDAQALGRSKVPTKIQIGREITQGRGAGADPAVGAQAALDAKEQIQEALHGADMVFITAGLGGGTGTGAAPIVAEIAKGLGILTVAVVTRPFRFEGPQRMKKANEGLDRLREFVDTCIIVSNDRLLEVVGAKATLKEAFSIANNVLTMGVQSISELINVPGLINVDFSDVRAIMNETGGAVMGVGIGKGENRATEAVKKACASPLLDKIVIDGARGVLICVTGGADMTLFEINEATTMVYEAASPDANIIFGAVIDDRLKDEIRVTIIATGFEDKHLKGTDPKIGDELRGAGNVSLKNKLESMFSGSSEKRTTSTAAPTPKIETPAPRPSDSTASAKAVVPGQADPTPTAKAVFAKAEPAVEAKREADVLDFNRPDNPLRSGSAPMFADEEKEEAKPEVAATAAGNGKSGESFEDDLETPPFLKRRKNLFE
ncbi:MAG: cell division protein FtsZ [Candidatus Sumerlaeaceae bacterium]|nr:cell division protein FtsZ [Candidatus Sumerlaeaceae bacterium]